METMSFWKTKTFQEMTSEEWESLCDNCGKCCLIKLEDDKTGELFYTSVACNLIDLKTCRCMRYRDRTQLVPTCLDLRQHDFQQFNWLPSTCAYRLLSEKQDLPSWHPLMSNSSRSVEQAGISIKSYALKESDVEDPRDHVIQWQE